jgi:hypothetical protein
MDGVASSYLGLLSRICRSPRVYGPAVILTSQREVPLSEGRMVLLATRPQTSAQLIRATRWRTAQNKRAKSDPTGLSIPNATAVTSAEVTSSGCTHPSTTSPASRVGERGANPRRSPGPPARRRVAGPSFASTLVSGWVRPVPIQCPAPISSQVSQSPRAFSLHRGRSPECCATRVDTT